MGRKKSQRLYSALPGYESEREVKAGPGGHVVLFDRTVAPQLKGSTRWVIIHFPSQKSQSFSGKTKAMQAMRVLEVGQDMWDILPFEGDEMPGSTKVNPPPHTPIVNQHQEITTPATGGLVDTSTRFQQALEKHFSEEEVCGWIRELCEAEKEIVIRGGREEADDVVMVPDWMTREKGRKLLLSYLVGQPIQRQETVVKNVATSEQVMEKLRNDPKYRKAFRQTFEDLLRDSDDDIDMDAEIVDDEKEETQEGEG